MRIHQYFALLIMGCFVAAQVLNLSLRSRLDAQKLPYTNKHREVWKWIVDGPFCLPSVKCGPNEQRLIVVRRVVVVMGLLSIPLAIITERL